jgi:flagellar hook-length control protein FliK
MPTGTQTVTVMLHPEDLGDVRATLTVSNNEVTVRLVASTSEGANAIRSAMPDLQSGLSQDGQHSTVLLGDPSGGNAFGRQSDPEAGTAYERASAAASQSGTGESVQSLSTPAVSGPGTTSTHRLLDVRL